MASETPGVPPVSMTTASHLGLPFISTNDPTPTAATTLTPTTSPATIDALSNPPPTSTAPSQPKSTLVNSLERPGDPQAPSTADDNSRQEDVLPTTTLVGETTAAAPKRQRGRQSWARGTKHDYLESMEDAWLVATSTGTEAAGKFYTRCTNGFLHKFGYDVPIEDDHPAPNPDPNPEQLAAPPPAPPGLTEAEAKRRSKYTRTLRQVRLPPLPPVKC